MQLQIEIAVVVMAADLVAAASGVEEVSAVSVVEVLEEAVLGDDGRGHHLGNITLNTVSSGRSSNSS